jgi:hypothetical protein
MMTRLAIRTAVALCLIPLWVHPAAAQDPDPTRLMAMVGSYLEILDRMGKVSGDPRSALMHATNSIKEVYEQSGRKGDAVPELRKILDGLEDPAARTAVHFAITDIYKETGQKEKALEELRALVAENKAVLGRRK